MRWPARAQPLLYFGFRIHRIHAPTGDSSMHDRFALSTGSEIRLGHDQGFPSFFRHRFRMNRSRRIPASRAPAPMSHDPSAPRRHTRQEESDTPRGHRQDDSTTPTSRIELAIDNVLKIGILNAQSCPYPSRINPCRTLMRHLHRRRIRATAACGPRRPAPIECNRCGRHGATRRSFKRRRQRSFRRPNEGRRTASHGAGQHPGNARFGLRRPRELLQRLLRQLIPPSPTSVLQEPS